MPYKGRGPRDWKPGMKPDIVKGDPGEEFFLSFPPIKIKKKKDLPKHPDLKVNAELAIERKDPVELYTIYLYENERPIRKFIGELLWFPTMRRGGVASLETWREGIEEAEWTDAASELEVLERWVEGEMEVDMSHD